MIPRVLCTVSEPADRSIQDFGFLTLSLVLKVDSFAKYEGRTFEGGKRGHMFWNDEWTENLTVYSHTHPLVGRQRFLRRRRQKSAFKSYFTLRRF